MSVLLNLAIALDQGLNCLWYVEGDGDGWGLPDEMISARALRLYLQDLIDDRPMRLINLLFFWQFGPDWKLNHCERAWATEVRRSQLPDHYRGEQCLSDLCK